MNEPLIYKPRKMTLKDALLSLFMIVAAPYFTFESITKLRHPTGHLFADIYNAKIAIICGLITLIMPFAIWMGIRAKIWELHVLNLLIQR